MSSYPNLPISWDSSRTTEESYEVSRSDAGTARVVRFSPFNIFKFRLEHKRLRQVQVDELMTFYEGYKNLVFDLDWPKYPEMYKCKFIKVPKIKPSGTDPRVGSLFDVTVELGS